jgi:hypothetical protein
MKLKLLFGCLFVTLSICAGAQSQESKTRISAENKKGVLKLYPNPSYDGRISIISLKKETLYFYIFDMEGKLVYQALLENNEKKAIENLNKGTYLYTAFENDQSIEEGKLIIK